jgi:proliferating cell nuclear antigen
MVKLVFKSANDLKNIIGLVSCINDEVRFLFNENGFLIRVMDSNRIAMVSLNVQKDFLEEYDLSGQQKADITISLNQLEKLLRGASQTPITLEVKALPSQTVNRLYIEQGKPYNRRFDMPILEPAENQPALELKSEPRNNIKMTVNGLRTIIEDVKLVSDYITFKATNEMFIVEVHGALLSYNATMKPFSEHLLNLEVSETDATASFQLHYLDEITKAASKIAQTVTVQISNNMPIKLTFETPLEIQLWYAIAPRIEHE